MPRQARLDCPGTLHHVMVRGIEGRDIFVDDSDREDFLSRVRKSALDTGTRILAWALMNNHVHLLLFSGKAGLAAFMRRLLTGYAVRFNRRHRRVGHLFQNRYKSVVCEENPYLLELVRYIHLNPLRGSVVKNLEELNSYRWSGHGVLLGRVRNDWQETEYVLRLFGGERKKAIRAYRRFLGGSERYGAASGIGGGRIDSKPWGLVEGYFASAWGARNRNTILGFWEAGSLWRLFCGRRMQDWPGRCGRKQGKGRLNKS